MVVLGKASVGVLVFLSSSSSGDSTSRLNVIQTHLSSPSQTLTFTSLDSGLALHWYNAQWMVVHLIAVLVQTVRLGALRGKVDLVIFPIAEYCSSAQSLCRSVRVLRDKISQYVASGYHTTGSVYASCVQNFLRDGIKQTMCQDLSWSPHEKRGAEIAQFLVQSDVLI